MINIIKVYNHKKDNIIKKHISIHSCDKQYNRHFISYAELFSSMESNKEYSRGMIEKCRRLLDLYG